MDGMKMGGENGWDENDIGWRGKKMDGVEWDDNGMG